LKTVVKRQKTRDERQKTYEAMFLVDSAEATADWEGITAAIKNILEKAGAEIVSIRKWDERKLAYEVNGHTRGTYILCYFKAEGEKLRDIERDVQLSERIMRVLILRAEEQAVEREQKTDNREQKKDDRE
jgi:small subunit ribosomal protein S6